MDKETAANINYIKFFLLILVAAALVSLSYKFFLMFSASKFKFASFNVLYLGKDAYFIHIEQGSKLSIFEFPKNRDFSSQNSRLTESIIIGMPIDSYIISKNGGGFTPDTNFMSRNTLFSILFNPVGYSIVDMNDLDLIKIFIYTKGIPRSGRDVRYFNSPDPEFISQNLSYLFDSQVFNEKKSVQIINATGVDGLGGKVSLMLKNAGYNVVSVESGDEAKSSIMTSDTNSVSVRRLEDFFNIPVTLDNSNSIADITLVISGDLIKN